jgi:hypothetical protein
MQSHVEVLLQKEKEIVQDKIHSQQKLYVFKVRKTSILSWKQKHLYPHF